jgi:hypothetical protein
VTPDPSRLTYTAGDQSGLGHQWCDEGYANDYAHKYGNARNDFAGTNPMAFAPTGFIWDNARTHGKSARIFGEFTNRTVVQPANATWTDFYTAWKNGTPGPTIVGASSVKSAQPITSSVFPGYDLRIPEQIRADLFLQEFREFERNQNLPELIVMLLPIDHTQGTSPGFPTPRAMVADNDLAETRLELREGLALRSVERPRQQGASTMIQAGTTRCVAAPRMLLLTPAASHVFTPNT